MKNLLCFLLILVCLNISGLPDVLAEEQSVRPGINSYYMDPDWQQWKNQFETPGREVYDRRLDILRASGVTPGMAVADIGAGTGLFTRLFSPQVGAQGKVVAVDISRPFVENILRESRERNLINIEGVINSPGDVMLDAKSIDLAFTVDTYHHFEYPQSMLASIHKALRSGGRLIVIDFRKHPGKSSGWVMGHVRADMKKVIDEITSAGFVLIDDKPLLRTNYFLEFRKLE
ncbi:MAG: methyltransferase domain-containing protein [Gammaproteobacteria bacterium]